MPDAAAQAHAFVTSSNSASRLNAARTSRNIPSTPNTNPAMDGIEPPAPLCHSLFETMNGMISRCGSGNHTVPNCKSPGVLESNTRRAMLMCATASP